MPVRFRPRAPFSSSIITQDALVKEKFALQLVKFGLVGVAATAVYTAVFTGVVELLAMPPVMAVLVAFSLAVLVSFFGHQRWTFNVAPVPGQLKRFVMVALIGLVANVLITFVVVNVLGLWYGLAILVSVILVPGLTFVLSKRWAFVRR